jgi:hypothetical protein
MRLYLKAKLTSFLRADHRPSAFDKMAEQVEACATEFNILARRDELCCERTANRVAVYKASYPRLTVELTFEDRAGIVAMRRQRLEDPTDRRPILVTDLRYQVTPDGMASLQPGDYTRLARQLLWPIIEACRSTPPTLAPVSDTQFT